MPLDEPQSLSCEYVDYQLSFHSRLVGLSQRKFFLLNWKRHHHLV